MSENKMVKFWRGSRENYETLKKAGILDYWTRYSVKDIDEVNSVGTKIAYTWTEYYGDNCITEAPGEVLPVNDILANAPAYMNPGDRYIIVPGGEWSENGIHMSVPTPRKVELYTCVLNQETGRASIVSRGRFNLNQSFRVKNKEMKAFTYNDNKKEFLTYDDCDAGNF